MAEKAASEERNNPVFKDIGREMWEDEKLRNKWIGLLEAVLPYQK